MATETYGQRVVRELHFIKVYLFQVGNHRGIQLLSTQLGVSQQSTADERVLAGGVYHCVAVVNVCLSRHVVEVPFAIS